jgi:hypothetical protein
MREREKDIRDLEFEMKRKTSLVSEYSKYLTGNIN